MLARTLGPLLLLALLLPAAAVADDLEQRVAVGEGARLRIELDAGNVTVASHAAPEVRIEARARGLGASAVHFRLRDEDGVLVLSGVSEPWLDWLGSGPRIQVRAWVPADCEVELETARPQAAIGSLARSSSR